MNILVLNSGSSSLKFRLIETGEAQIAANEDRALARGSVEKIGEPGSLVTLRTHSGEIARLSGPIPDHQVAIETAFRCLRDARVVVNEFDIDGVGHRVVHGGETLTESVLIDEAVVRAIEACSELAPLHNPHNLKGYFASRQVLPHCRHVAVFDTAFHATLPVKAFLYGLPYEHYTRDRVRRYGFHGTSHRYIAQRWAQMQAADSGPGAIISCHLGNGCSVCAVDRGRSVDTSMGFTPLAGLLMGTRSGDIDAGAVFYLMRKGDLTVGEADRLLNEQSGLLGISGLSNDMRDLLAAERGGNERAGLAIDMFAYRVRKYIGAYFAVLGGARAVVFTAGVGEHSPPVRARICEGLAPLGIQLNAERNQAAAGAETRISADGSPVQVWVIPTDEELMIARDAFHCMQTGGAV